MNFNILVKMSLGFWPRKQVLICPNIYPDAIYDLNERNLIMGRTLLYSLL